MAGAVKKEIESTRKDQVWELVDRPKNERKITNSRWIFKTKAKEMAGNTPIKIGNQRFGVVNLPKGVDPNTTHNPPASRRRNLTSLLLLELCSSPLSNDLALRVARIPEDYKPGSWFAQ